MAEIVMPRLSDTMEEGTILRWLIAEGDTVRRGQEIVEIETDKANMTYESDLEGPIALLAAEGDTLPVGAVIARVGAGTGTEGPAREQGVVENGAGRHGAGEPDGAEEASGTPRERAETQRERDEIPREPSAPPSREPARVKASPLARRIAREQDIDLSGLTGSGPGGRIVKADVQAATASASGAGPEPTEPVAPATSIPRGGLAVEPGTPAGGPPAGAAAGVARAKGETTEVELTRTQRTIARRMAESKATIPHFALQAEIDMGACAALRAELKRVGRADAPTYNDMVVKACALALREHPRANSSYRDGRVQLHGRVNVGVAVAVEAQDPTAGGALIVPTVFDADTKALGEIARETRALAARVREGAITPPELGGGTFTVSNLGMFGIDAFTAIVNPPQAAILAIGAVRARPVVIDGGGGPDEIAARPTMAVTLACDHRVLYGADAARFLARVHELLETPTALSL